MSSPDPRGASRARAAGPGSSLSISEVVTSVEYDIVGEREGRFAQVRNGVCDIDDVHTEVERFTRANTGSTWHVIARTTTVETVVEPLPQDPPPPARDGGARPSRRAR